MTITADYQNPGPDRNQVDSLAGPALLEFGTGWCGFCRTAQPLVAKALQDHPTLPHLKVEDGSGRPLGRSFKVKLWPTLVFLRDGQEVARLVRPQSTEDIAQAIAKIAGPGG